MTAFLLCVGLAIITSYIPGLLLIWILGMTVCAGLYTYKNGTRSGLLLAVVALSASAATTGSPFLWTVCGAFSLSGCLLGHGLRNEYRLPNLIAFSGIGSLLVMGFAIYVYNYIVGANPVNSYLTEFFESVLTDYGSSFDMAVDLGMFSAEAPEAISELKRVTLDLIRYIQLFISLYLPGLLGVMSGLVSYICFGIIRFILKKKQILFMHLQGFRHLRMDRLSGWILIIVWLAQDFIKEQDVFALALSNLGLVVSALFFICGQSLVLYFIHKKIQNIGIRIIAYIGYGIVILLGEIGAAITMMLAIADSTLDLRNLRINIKKG